MAMKIIAGIGAAILILAGLFALLGANGQGSVVIVGLVLIGVGIGLIFLAARRPAPAPGSSTSNVTLNVQLPGNVSLDTLKCKSCGGALKADNIQMVAGAPVVSCPYCKTSYQLTEEPKW
jgi:hypothetical protein